MRPNIRAISFAHEGGQHETRENTFLSLQPPRAASRCAVGQKGQTQTQVKPGKNPQRKKLISVNINKMLIQRRWLTRSEMSELRNQLRDIDLKIRQLEFAEREW